MARTYITKKLPFVILGILFLLLVVFFVYGRFFYKNTTDGMTFSTSTLIAAAFGPSKELDASKNPSTDNTVYITYDREKHIFACAQDAQEAKRLLVNDLEPANVPEPEKEEARNYNISAVTKTTEFFEFILNSGFSQQSGKTMSTSYRIHNCSYLKLITKSQVEIGMIYNQRPITASGVEKLVRYFGLPHFITGKGSEDRNNYYYTIYSAEPHTASRFVVGSCDYAELVKEIYIVNKTSGVITHKFEYPQIFAQTDNCNQKTNNIMDSLGL